MKKFPEYRKFDLSQINKEVLEGWNRDNLFQQTIEARKGCPSFVFFEGPPSANGMPGIHHVLARTIKDIFCRYKTMSGYQVHRKAGWDTHGLPVELGVEKSLGITKEDIGKKISVDDYNAACRREVMKFTREWETLTNRMGYWVDMSDPYITYDNRYIESVWWLLKRLYQKGYLYKGYTIQPYSPAAGTGLSTHELNQPGCYRDVKDTTCIAQFEVLQPTPEMQGWGKPYFIAWTTTPWTLPSNTALCVGTNIDYCIVRTYNPYSGKPITVIAAEALLPQVLGKGANLPLEEYKAGQPIPYQIVGKMRGKDLVGMHYAQLMPWVNPGEGAFRVISGDFVSTEEGTGIVHIAGTFGADDNRVSKQNGVPPLHLIDKDGNLRPMVDLTGKFYELDDLDPQFVKDMVNVDEYKIWQGKYVKNAYDPAKSDKDETLDVEICMYLKQRGMVFKIEKHTHSYPHCWRTDKPVLYYPLDSWFIKTTDARERMMQLNDTVKWKPSSTGTGRFGKWLENLQDWNLSRSRYWGTPLPIWRTEDGSEEVCIGSVQELYDKIEQAVEAGLMPNNPLKDKGFVPGNYSAENYALIDLHRPYVDDFVLVSPSGKPMHRETDLIDVWFDSGSMPYAQMHYPFENKEIVDNGTVFPADFIAEGVDQTRGWFFTLHAIGTMAFDSVAFKNVISNGLVLDKNGNKMSKRLGNAVNPFEAIETYGSDPLRWYMISNSSPWDNLKFDGNGVQESSRKFFATLYNTYSFFALYANVDGFDASAPQVDLSDRPEIDRWILSLLNTLVTEVRLALDDYEPTRAARAIAAFVSDNLSNWYVRLNRKRFWGGDLGKNKLAAYQTLYTCLLTVAKLMAPISPFYADRLYQDLTGLGSSVHLADFPVADASVIDNDLEQQMQMAQTLTSMVLALRRKVNIKVRQPLAKMLVPVTDQKQRQMLDNISALVLAEVNVKQLEAVSADNDIFVKKIKPDFKKLGPKCGKLMKTVAQILRDLDTQTINCFEKTGFYTIDIEGKQVQVTTDDVEIYSEDIPGWLVANEGTVTVALDVQVTPELRLEGISREFINRIQNLRKSKDFDITDRINISYSPDAEIEQALQAFGAQVAEQVLAVRIAADDTLVKTPETDIVEIEGNDIIIAIEKA